MLRSPTLKFLLSLALPLAVVAVPAVAPREARADAPAAAPAPAPRTAFGAPFQRYLVAPNGRTMGLLLADGTFVFTPGRSLSKDAPSLQTGTRLDIEGVVISNRIAKSEVVSSVFDRYARIWRRWLEAKASKTLSACIGV